MPDITTASSAYATESCQIIHAEAFIAERRYRQLLIAAQAYKLTRAAVRDGKPSRLSETSNGSIIAPALPELEQDIILSGVPIMEWMGRGLFLECHSIQIMVYHDIFFC